MICNLCQSTNLAELINFGSHVPSNNCTDKAYPVELYLCNSCGLTQLQNSVPAEILYKNYITLSSWKPQPHITAQVESLRKFLPFAASIIEIGGNDGSFLKSLGYRNSLNIEPAQDAFIAATNNGIRTINQFLTPDLAERLVATYGHFDCVVSRQNLEHLRDLPKVAESIKTLLKPDGIALIEVPDFETMILNGDYSIWEQHVNYFTPDTLRYFMSRCSIDIIEERFIEFSGGGMWIIGQNRTDIQTSMGYLPYTCSKTRQFASGWPQYRKTIWDSLDHLKHAQKRRIAVYGAGCRGISIVDFTGINSIIDCFFDDRIEKVGTTAAGLRVLSPAALCSVDTLLLAVNAENEQAVIDRHPTWPGEWLSILPPSQLDITKKQAYTTPHESIATKQSRY